MSKQFSIDLGNAYLKLFDLDAGGRLSRANRWGRFSIAADVPEEAIPDHTILDFDGDTWIVGAHVKRHAKINGSMSGSQRFANRNNNRIWRMYIAALLAEMSPKRGGDVELIVSVPLEGFRNLRDQVTDWTLGHYEVGFGGKTLNFTVTSVTPVPEGFGTLCFFALNERGGMGEYPALVQRSVLVLDSGGYSLDILGMNNMRTNNRYKMSVPAGIIDVRFALSSILLAEFSRNIKDPGELDAVLQVDDHGCHYFTHSGQVEVTPQVVEARDVLFEDLMGYWNGILDEGTPFDTVIISGGGSVLLANPLADQLRHNNIIAADPADAIYTNAIGQARYVAFKAQRGG